MHQSQRTALRPILKYLGFAFLMLSSGLLPGLPPELLPAAVAYVAVSVLAARLFPQVVSFLSQLLAPVLVVASASLHPRDWLPIATPIAPGTPGTSEPRAPSRRLRFPA